MINKVRMMTDSVQKLLAVHKELTCTSQVNNDKLNYCVHYCANEIFQSFQESKELIETTVL